MRRKDREIRELDQLENILKECDAVRIGAQDEAGLFIVPMNFGYRLEGEKLTLFVHSAPEGRKVEAFWQRGMVAFEMDCGHALRSADTACGHSFTYCSIMGSGVIRPLMSQEEKKAGLGAIMEHMTGRTWDFPDESVDRTAVFALEVSQWTGKSNQAG